MATNDLAGLVIHLSSGAEDDWRTALRYAANFISASDGTRRVDVVVNGPALSLILVDSVLQGEVSELQALGTVEFSACANSMAAQGVGPAELHPAAHSVAAAVLHLAERQWAGWAYLRP